VSGSHVFVGARPFVRRTCIWVFDLLFLLVAALGPPATAQTPVTIRVNVGGPAYTDSGGRVWSADTGYNTGDAFTTTTSVTGTADPALYQSGRWDGLATPEMQYAFAVPNGWYQVRLHFAEGNPPAQVVNGRIFNVQMEDEIVFQSFDIFAEAGANTALIKTAVMQVTDGQLNITFLHGPVEHPFVNAIEIVSRQGPASQEPTAPTGLSAASPSISQIDLAWGQATDNVGVTGYRVERCQGESCTNFAQIAAPVTNAYTDSGLSASTL
jgi:Malectin domain